MFPDAPTCRRGGLVIGAVDEECQARIVTKGGRPFGCWLDDTTPNLDEWMAKAVAKYGPLGQTVFVCVPPGRPHCRYRPSPPVVNVQEWYPYGMGCPPSAWGPVPACEAYCIQKRYPGTHGKRPPTATQHARLLAQVMAHHPKFIFEF